MKKAILLFGFFLIAITLIWRLQTSRLKHFVAEIIECDAISSKGFPFIMEIKLKNPRTIDKTFPISHEGTVTIGTTFFMNKGWIHSSGKTTINQKTLLDGEFSLTKNDLKRAFQFLQDPLFAHLNPFQKGIQGFVVGNSTILAKNLMAIHQGEVVFELSNGSIDWKKSSQDPSQSTLLVDLQDYSIRSEWTDLMPKNLSQFAMKANISCPVSDWLDFSVNDPLPVMFEIEKWTAADAYSEAESSGKITMNKKDGDLLSGHIVLHTSQKYIKQYPLPEQKKFLSKTASFLAHYPVLEKVIKHHWKELQPLIPDFPSFGTIQTEMALRFQGSEHAFAQNGELQIDQFKISSDPYCFNIKGEIKTSVPAVALNVTIANHRNWIHDLTNYYNRWHKFLTHPDILGENILPATEKMENKIASFLESLSEIRSDKELTLSFKYAHPNYTVGALTPDKFNLAVEKLSTDLLAELKPAPKVEPVKIELPAKVEPPAAEVPAKVEPTGSSPAEILRKE